MNNSLSLYVPDAESRNQKDKSARKVAKMRVKRKVFFRVGAIIFMLLRALNNDKRIQKCFLLAE